MKTKKMMIALTMMLAMAATGNAMSYEQARNEALFLTDKMAYELNLTDEQYEAAYEINLDYLMGVTSYDDVYGTYWERRNLDLSYVLLDWQWNAFCAASYFFRPLYWADGLWHFAVYGRYPHRDYFYFGRPVFYASYRGGHAWHAVGGRGYYYGRRDHFRPIRGREHFGMLDRWNRGDFHHSHNHHGRFGNVHRGNGGSNAHGRFGNGNRIDHSNRGTVDHGNRGNADNSHLGGVSNRNGHSGFGGTRSSSTRTTVNHGSLGNSRNSGSFGGSRSSNGGSFSGSRSSSGGSFSGGRSGGNFGGAARSGGNFGGAARSNGGGSHGFGRSR